MHCYVFLSDESLSTWVNCDVIITNKRLISLYYYTNGSFRQCSYYITCTSAWFLDRKIHQLGTYTLLLHLYYVWNAMLVYCTKNIPKHMCYVLKITVHVSFDCFIRVYWSACLYLMWWIYSSISTVPLIRIYEIYWS